MSVMQPKYPLFSRTFVGAILQTNIKLEEKSFSFAKEHYIGELRRGLDTCNLKKKLTSKAFLTRLSHFSRISPVGALPSGKGSCATATPACWRSSVLYVGSVAQTKWLTLCD